MKIEWLVFRDSEVLQLTQEQYVREETRIGEYNYALRYKAWSRVVEDSRFIMQFENIEEDEVPMEYRMQALLMT